MDSSSLWVHAPVFRALANKGLTRCYPVVGGRGHKPKLPGWACIIAGLFSAMLGLVGLTLVFGIAVMWVVVLVAARGRALGGPGTTDGRGEPGTAAIRCRVADVPVGCRGQRLWLVGVPVGTRGKAWPLAATAQWCPRH